MWQARVADSTTSNTDQSNFDWNRPSTALSRQIDNMVGGGSQASSRRPSGAGAGMDANAARPWQPRAAAAAAAVQIAAVAIGAAVDAVDDELVNDEANAARGIDILELVNDEANATREPSDVASTVGADG